jgi:hypothetical protein
MISNSNSHVCFVMLSLRFFYFFFKIWICEDWGTNKGIIDYEFLMVKFSNRVTEKVYGVHEYLC